MSSNPQTNAVYSKLYIAVLDEVPDHMVPTLVAHSILAAHQEWVGIRPGNYDTDVYDQWLYESFRKCVVRVNRKEFLKISELGKVYLGHENTTLGGEKSCVIPYPVMSNAIPKVLQFSKLWKPKQLSLDDLFGTILVLERYEALLLSKVTVPGELAPLEGDEMNDLHLLWMIKELRSNKSQSATKKHRWLGFLQGVMTAKGYLNVLEERELTRSIFNGL